MIWRSRSSSLFISCLSICFSVSISMPLFTTSSSVPRISDKSSSFPSQSIFKGSSMDMSFLCCDAFLRNMSISFSIHREAYVASLMFLSGQNVFTALISPIVPIDTRSSIPTPVDSNFFAMYTTSLRLCIIRSSRAFFSSVFKSSNVFCSSSFVNGGGSCSAPFM